MAKARIELVGSATWEGRGYKFARGAAQVITKEVDIEFFSRTGGFTVTPLKAVKPKAPPAAAVVDEQDDDEDEGEDENAPHTEESLKVLIKGDLVALGATDFALDIDPGMKKPEMIAAILEAQAEADA